jgi:hypothetical protein
MAVNLREDVVGDVQPGDLVRMYYARLPSDSFLAKAYWEAMASGEMPASPVEYVYFGHELFRLEVLPDNAVPKGIGPEHPPHPSR